MFYGLGQNDVAVLHSFPPDIHQFLVEGMSDPESRDEVMNILRAPNPHAEFARQVAMTAGDAIQIGMQDGGSGLAAYEAGMGRSFFKKIMRFHRKIFSTIKKVNAKIARLDPIYKATAKIRKSVMKEVRKFAPIIIGVAGAVLAPFTGGLSLAAAAVLSAAYELRKKKIEAAKAVKAGKAEAGQMQAAVNAQEAQVGQQADDFYAKNQEYFATAGLTPDKWAALTVDQKVNYINEGQAGTLQADPSIVALMQKAQAQGVLPTTPNHWYVMGTDSSGNQISQDFPDQATANAFAQQQIAAGGNVQVVGATNPAAAVAPPTATQALAAGVPPPTPAAAAAAVPPPVLGTQTPSTGYSGAPSSVAAPGPSDTGGPGPDQVPDTSQEAAATAAGPAPADAQLTQIGGELPMTEAEETSAPNIAGSFDILVEGQKVTEHPIDNLNHVGESIEAVVQPGDRFEVLFNGATTGLKIKTQDGYASIPPEQADQVRAMTHEQVLALINGSTQKAADSTGRTAPAPITDDGGAAPSGGGMVLPLALVLGVGYGLSKMRR